MTTEPTLRDVWLAYHRNQVRRYERRLLRERDEATRKLCQDQVEKHRMAVAALTEDER